MMSRSFVPVGQPRYSALTAVPSGSVIAVGQRDGHAGACPAGTAQQVRGRLRDRRQHACRVAAHVRGTACPRDDAAAEPDERDREGVRVDMRRERDGAVGGDQQAVRRTALGAAARAGVHLDQAQVAQLGGDRPGRCPGDAERRGQRGPRGRLPGMDQPERGTEQAAAALSAHLGIIPTRLLSASPLSPYPVILILCSC